jgi:hypothetical protein
VVPDKFICLTTTLQNTFQRIKTNASAKDPTKYGDALEEMATEIYREY